MKKIIMALLVTVFMGSVLINSCHKDLAPSHIGSTASFTEEFQDVPGLEAKGWKFIDNSSNSSNGPHASWGQGRNNIDKSGEHYGFTAYSYTNSTLEYAYSHASATTTTFSVSGWMITPVLSVKNGDKISFYTRSDNVHPFANRMQVRLANSSSTGLNSSVVLSTGNFSSVLFDINPNQFLEGYPTTWTKYEYTFSGITGNQDVRIGFRHYLNNGSNVRGIGIDLFRFQSN